MTSEKKSLLLAQLQEAIDEAISDSPRVSEVVAEMKLAGYDLCLILESTVAITPNEEHQTDGVPEPMLTDEDLEFLHELNIAA